MAPGPEPESLADVDPRQGHICQPGANEITLDWQVPPSGRRSSAYDLLETGPSKGIALGCAGFALAMMACGAIWWTAVPPVSARDDMFELPRSIPTVRATPQAAAVPPSVPPVASSLDNGPVVGPDVAPAWNIMLTANEPSRDMARPTSKLDILTEAAATPTGSIPLGATGAEEEPNEHQALPARRGALGVRRAAGLDSANKARDRQRNTKWTSTFFNQ